MAQEKFGFFQGTTEDPRSYDSADMATAFSILASSGVSNISDNLELTAADGNMNTRLNYGTAMIRGHYYSLQNDGSGAKRFTHTTEASLNRIDRIVLRLDLAARTITAEKRIGTAGATPTAPALTRDSEIYELSLAQVYVHAGAALITAEDITDERGDDTVCGMIAPESLRASAIEALVSAAILLATDDVLTFSAQELSETQRETARQNIDAQRQINLNGILKATIAGGVATAGAGVDYAIPLKEVSATLSAGAWSGSVAPFTQDIVVGGITATTKGVCAGLPATVSDAQFEAALEALLRVSAQGTNSITIKAHGEKPAVDIPVLVQIKG